MVCSSATEQNKHFYFILFFSAWKGEDQQKQSSLQGDALPVLALVLQISKALAVLPSP